MPSHGGSIRPKLARNESEQCDIQRCERRRHGLTRLCAMHRSRRRRFGHAEARMILPRDYMQERREVAALFKANPEHAGLLSALAFIREWLDASAQGDKQQPGFAHVARLDRRGVTPMIILLEVSAVWLHVDRYQKPDDVRLDFSLALAMLRLAPRDFVRGYQYPSGERRYYRDAGHGDRAAIGDYLRSSLAPLFVRVVVACREREARAQQQHAAEQAAFVIPSTKLKGNR